MKKLRITHRRTVAHDSGDGRKPIPVTVERSVQLPLATAVTVAVAILFAGIILGALWVALNDSVIQQGVSHVY